MAISTEKSDHQAVSNHIEKLEPNLRETIEFIRQLILSTNEEIGERIKWNNPSFFYKGEMLAFNPKEYEREIVVMNLYKGRIMLVFPSGAKVNDSTGLLEGKYSDGRKTLIFKDLNEVKNKSLFLQKIIQDWLALVEK